LTPEEKLAAIGEILEIEFGIPKRKKRDPLKILIKTILSQNTNDKNRDLAFDRLMKEFPGWDELADAPSSRIAAAIRPGGLHNQKAERIKGILSFIKDNFPNFDISPLCRLSLDEAKKRLTALPGIGVKTFAILMLFSCGKEVFPVDTHIHRIMKRLGMVPEKATAEKTFRLLTGKVARGKSYSLHLNLIKLGRTICRARKPDCLRCFISSFCLYYVGNKEVIK
jgi:endonuclease-3